MLKNSSRPKRVLVYAGLIFGFLVLALIVYIVATITISGVHDQQNVQRAVAEIQLPSEYQLVSSVYDNQHCLDVCAHTLLTYRYENGSVPDIEPVQSKLRELGYVYNDPFFYKTVNNKRVHVSVYQIFAPPQLTVDVSL
jgi:hypothetical protein